MRNNTPKDDVEVVEDRQVFREGQEPPMGRMGVDDIRTQAEQEGHGKVADAAGVHSQKSTAHRGEPSGSLNDDPSAEDPYGTQLAPGEFAESESQIRKMQKADVTGQAYPSYEVGQDPEDRSTGGSTDTHNFMTHANSGDETEGS